MKVNVRIIDLATGQLEEETFVNFSRPISRRWLDKKMQACFSKGRGVQLWNADDKEPGNG